MQKPVTEKEIFCSEGTSSSGSPAEGGGGKKLLDSGKVDTVQDAAERTGISQKLFLQNTRDDIFPFHEETRERRSPLLSRWTMNRGFCRLSCGRLHGFMETFSPFIKYSYQWDCHTYSDCGHSSGRGDAEAMVETIEQNEGIHYLKILGRE